MPIDLKGGDDKRNSSKPTIEKDAMWAVMSVVLIPMKRNSVDELIRIRRFPTVPSLSLPQPRWRLSRQDEPHQGLLIAFSKAVYYLLVVVAQVESWVMVGARRAHNLLHTHPHSIPRFEFLDSDFDFDLRNSGAEPAGGLAVYRAQPPQFWERACCLSCPYVLSS